jgi:hypothetical protein
MNRTTELEIGCLHVVLSCRELIVNCILDVNNVETTVVTFPVCDDTDTTHVTTTCGHSNGARIELDKVGDLARCQINLHRVIDLDGGIAVANAKFSISTILQPKACPTADRCDTHVRASCVTRKGIPPAPSCTRLTLPSL